MVADRHHGDDLLPVQEQGQRPLVDDRRLDRAALLVDAGDRLGQARVVRVGQQQGLAHGARPFLCAVSPASGRLTAIRAQGATSSRRIGPPCPPRSAARSRRRRGAASPRRAARPAAGPAAGSAWPPGSCCSSPWRRRLPDTAELFAESAQAKVTVLAADGAPIAVRGGSGGRLRAAGRDLALAGRGRGRDRGPPLPPPFRRRPGRARRGRVLDNLRAGAVVAGGSTITQQLAKNLYLTPERSLPRKLQELTLAIWLETRLDKDQILTLYLNRVYLGAGAYGVEAASRRYFGKRRARPDPGRGGDAGGPAQGALGAGADQRPRPRPRARRRGARADAGRGLSSRRRRHGGARQAGQARARDRDDRRLVRRLGAGRADRRIWASPSATWSSTPRSTGGLQARPSRRSSGRWPRPAQRTGSTRRRSWCSTPAVRCARWSAAATTRTARSTARSRRAASPARPSSRSST